MPSVKAVRDRKPKAGAKDPLQVPELLRSIGHESSTTTIQSYVKPEAVSGAQQRRVMSVLDGGRLAS